MNWFPIRLVLTLSFSALAATVSMASPCVATEEGDDSPAVVKKKADYAIAVISDSGYLAQDPTCVAANMRYLGLTHVNRAIPALVAQLAYSVPLGPVERKVTFRYPAVDALRNIGEPALPALLEVLATKENDSVESKNALDVFMDIDAHRDNLDKALKRLKHTSAKETDPVRASRLQRAIQDARARWCRPNQCAE